MKTIPLPKFAPDARERWERVPDWARKEILESVWCGKCQIGTAMQLLEGKMVGRSLLLRGICKKCGGDVARVIEPEE
jgi:hypothetical protein